MIAPELDLSRFDLVPFPVAWVPELRRDGRASIRAMERDLLVLWNDGAPTVWADSCPHLGLPLSLGTIDGGRARCRYHGWAFDAGTGEVVEQPTLRKPQRCRMKRYGAFVAGDLVFAWTGDPDAGEVVRARLPEEVLSGFSLFRVTFDSPFYLALFSSVDYAHFAYHTGYSPLYAVYRRLRGNAHLPGQAFPSRVVSEDDRRVVVRIDDAGREIRMYATASEMDDGGINFFQTFVTPVGPMETLYWECFRPRSRSRVVNAVARAAFRTITTRLIGGEDRVWTRAAAPNFVGGRNINLGENDVPLGAHLRRFVIPVLRGDRG